MSNPPIRHGGRNLPVESQYEYGTRCGVWRVARLFKEKDVKITVYAVGQSILKSPDAAKRLVDDGHEFMSHGYRWIDHYALPLAVEKKQIEAGIEAIQKTTGGKAPLGWYYGRQSSSSKGLVCQVYKERGLEMLYQCDSYNDEMPYWEKHPLDAGKGLLIIPHTYDINDVQYANSPGFANPRVSFFLPFVSFEMGETGGGADSLSAGLARIRKTRLRRDVRRRRQWGAQAV
jgi:peptidoglycan/xylan/chitin deacetylase (PgdA/CDA1 family)